MKPEAVQVGDFVYCRSKYYRNQLQLPEALGLVIEVKRSNFKILYPDDKRCWLPREAIGIVNPEADDSSFLGKLHYLLKRVHAHECELIAKDGQHRLSARIDRIDQTTVDEIRVFLGTQFVSLVVVPEGMAFMQLEITFV